MDTHMRKPVNTFRDYANTPINYHTVGTGKDTESKFVGRTTVKTEQTDQHMTTN